MIPFDAVVRAGATPDAPILLLLHGTGGDEHSLLSVADAIAPEAAVLSPRGRVLEQGMPRYFRRFAEGVLDLDDWRVRSDEVSRWVSSQRTEQGWSTNSVVALGYSNGANLAQGLLLLHPATLEGAILMRPMFLTDNLPDVPSLDGQPILILSGATDPIVDPADPARIAAQLTHRGGQPTAISLPTGHGVTESDIEHARRWWVAQDFAAPSR